MKKGYIDKHGKNTHAELETDSDGNGGSAPLLRGKGFIEFSQRTIPHGSLHWPEMVKWAGHLLMHCTGGPEASHRLFIKKAMDRVRKACDEKTSGSMVDWIYRIHAWEIIIAAVKQLKSKRKRKRSSTTPQRKSPSVLFFRSRILKPNHHHIPDLLHNTFSPLQAGGDNLLSPDARVSYHEVRPI